MEQFSDFAKTLELLSQPAFAVRDGTIIYANRAAQECMLEQGMALYPLLEIEQEEYEALEGECISLMLHVEYQQFAAKVSKLQDCAVFVVDIQPEDAALQAMALAAGELRDPLGDMTGALHDFLQEASPAASRVSRHLHRILRLVNNMSDAYRYRQEFVPKLELKNVSAVFDEIFEKNKAKLEQVQVTLRYTGLSQELLCLIDEEKLERAVHNMLSNAVKASPAGGTVDAQLTRRGNKLYLTVCDRGSSTDTKVLRNSFSQYLRRPMMKGSPVGIGLGMVIIRCAAQAHNGTVLIRRNPEGGTNVTLSLAIRRKTNGALLASRLEQDYAGGWDHTLLELSDVFSSDLY